MNEVKKVCADCNTTKTPLWRSGPHGPQSLCNACGIRYRKRKMGKEGKPSSEIKREKSSSSNSSTIDYDGDFGDQMNMKESLKMRFCDFGDRMIEQTSSSSSSSSSSQLKKKQRSSSKRKLGEVEQAAALLMSLSCGSVLA